MDAAETISSPLSNIAVQKVLQFNRLKFDLQSYQTADEIITNKEAQAKKNIVEQARKTEAGKVNLYNNSVRPTLIAKVRQ